MSIGGLLGGTHALLVGVEDNGDDGLRLYLGHRSDGKYALVYDEDARREVQRAWTGRRGHITVPLPPPECIYLDEDVAA